MIEISTIVASIIVSAITAKIVATYYFKKVDGYVKEMCEMTNKNNEKTLSIVHKIIFLKRNISKVEKTWFGYPERGEINKRK